MEPFIGQIMMFAGSFAPVGWAFCDGQLLPISQNAALFSILGTQYGGDGRTTFALPDLRGRFPMHAGSGPGLTPRTQGQKAGQETQVLTTANLPAHAHDVRAATSKATENTPERHAFAGGTHDSYAKASPSVGMDSATISSTGSNQDFSIMPPFNTVRFCIALQGIYPSRS